MRRFYARVEHKVVVGDDLFNLLTVTSLILIRRHCGMKRPGPTFTYAYVRQVPPTDMHLLHKVASGCLSLHFSQIGFDEKGPYEG